MPAIVHNAAHATRPESQTTAARLDRPLWPSSDETATALEARSVAAACSSWPLALRRSSTTRRSVPCQLVGDGRLQALCGDDHRLFASLCLGASGAIAASAHLGPELFAQLCARVERGDLAGARALWQLLWPLTTALFAEPSPGPLKAALAAAGLMRNELRAPMTTASEAAMSRVARALEGLSRL